MASSSGRTRLPTFISLDMNQYDDDIDDDCGEGRQPSSSPPIREGMSPRRRVGAAVTPYTPKAKSTKTSTSPISGRRTHQKQPPSQSQPAATAKKITTTQPVTPSSPPAWEERKISRRSGRTATVPRESFLVGLCRQQDWKGALIRLQENPEEAEPLLCIQEEFQDTPFPLNLHLHNYTRPQPEPRERPMQLLYQETALSILCSFARFNSEQDQTQEQNLSWQLLQELLTACPKQAIISHRDAGHTALRALLRNETCNPKVLRLLLEVMKNGCTSQEEFNKMCTVADRDGLRPMDHIVLAFHQDTPAPLEILKTFVQVCGGGCEHWMNPAASGAMDPVMVSPLIRLLSLGNGSSVARLSPTASMDGPSSDQQCTTATSSSCTSTTSQVRAASRVSSSTSTSPVLAHPSHHSEQVLEATKYFVKEFPLLLDQTSRTTQCTPLHVALRNYGNYNRLIRCLLLWQQPKDENEEKCSGSSSDTTTTTSNQDITSDTIISPLILNSLQRCNQFGDLPLHVASSVGVPVPILRLVLEGTLQATTSASSPQQQQGAPGDPAAAVNLCWTVNHAGYTPIDLEWIRHMEDGKGLFMARSFYPLEAGGIKKTFWKQDEFYRVLLQQAVQQAMDVRATNPFLRAFHSNNPQRIIATNSSLQQRQPGLVASSSSLGAGGHLSRPFATRTTRTPRAGQVPPQQAPFQTTNPPPRPSEQPTWELLLHRIFLIMQTAATGQVPKTQTELVHCLLHSACKLSFPSAPSLPLPLLELILFMYPEQLLQAQSSIATREETMTNTQIAAANNRGNLPLHFAVQPQLYHSGPVSCCPSLRPAAATTCNGNEASTESDQHTCNEWETWCKQLLEHGPNACSTTNDVGQLPLHKALEYYSYCHNGSPFGGSQTSSTYGCDSQKRCITTTKQTELSHQEEARLNVVHALVDAFPNSVNVVDPVSHLMPFQLAASSPYMPLDAVFYLLRRSPDAVLD